VEALGREDFRRSFLVTVYYALGTVPLTLIISFLVAYALHRIALGRGLFRTLYFLPYVTSATAAAMVWRALLNPQGGVANALLERLGVPAQQWLLEPRGLLHILSSGAVPADVGPSLALCCIVLFDIWHGCGFAIVLFLAGLSSLPREYLEAARVDGAGVLRTLRHVVLPLLSPTILFLTTVGLIKSFQAFNSFFALTQGGRALGTTENLIMHIYANFYEYGYWGYGAAAATLLSIAILLLTALQWRIANSVVHYDS
jgi:ABC-type sugar transport system permease subunit